MPITRPNVNLYSINNLALDYSKPHKSRSMRDLRGTCRLFMYAPRKNAEIAERQGYI